MKLSQFESGQGRLPGWGDTYVNTWKTGGNYLKWSNGGKATLGIDIWCANIKKQDRMRSDHGSAMQVRPLYHEDPLEKKTATHSSILAWRIPWTEEPGGLQSSSVQSLSHVRLFSTPWTAACQASVSITNSWRLPKLMSIAGESHGQRSLVGYSPWGHRVRLEQLTFSHFSLGSLGFFFFLVKIFFEFYLLSIPYYTPKHDIICKQMMQFLK